MKTPARIAVGSHIQRMSCYCGLLAERLGLDAELIRVASRLHDVGMVAVTDGVLLKAGPLTPEERREMQDHAELGQRMLAGSGVALLDSAAEVAFSHHERYDGGGYPCGHAAEEIPLAGRIAAVADTFDARRKPARAPCVPGALRPDQPPRARARRRRARRAGRDAAALHLAPTVAAGIRR